MNNKLIRAALYCRVSTSDQNAAAQVRELRKAAAARGWRVVNEFVETASGSGVPRIQLDTLLAFARRGLFEVVMVWRLDRFGRSLIDLVGKIRALDEMGVRFVAIEQGIDTDKSSPEGRLLLHILASFAEFEKGLIGDRVRAGMKRYKEDFEAGRVGKSVKSASGQNLAPHRPVAVFDRVAAAKLLKEGVSYRQTAKRVGVSPATLHREFKKGA